MESINSLDLEIFNNEHNREYMEILNEMRCEDCNKIAIPPYKFKNKTYCFSCIEKIEISNIGSVIGPSRVEIMIIEKLKINCANCNQLINAIQLIHHQKNCLTSYKKIKTEIINYSFPKDCFILVSSQSDDKCDSCLQKVINKETHDCISILNDLLTKLNNRILSMEKRIIEFQGNQNGLTNKKANLDRGIIQRSMFSKDPQKIYFNKILIDYEGRNLPNMFTIYESVNSLVILAFPTKHYNINLISIDNINETIGTLKGHSNTIFCVRYYRESKTKDYLISSSNDHSIKVWDLSLLLCFLSIDKAFNSVYIWSCIIISQNKENYIISSVWNNELTKIHDFKGNLVKQFGDIKDKTIFIDYWNDNIEKENYVINCNNKDVKLYDFDSGRIFKSFQQGNLESSHCSAFIKLKERKPILYDSDNKGFLRIWDIYSLSLLLSIQIGECIIGIIFWNDNYILASDECNIIIVDLRLGKKVGTISNVNQTNTIGTISKIYLPHFGESLFTGDNNRICLWN